jgi:hypothetical protein
LLCCEARRFPSILEELESDIRSLEEAGTITAFIVNYEGANGESRATKQQSRWNPRTWFTYIKTFLGQTQAGGETGINGDIPGTSKFNGLSGAELEYLARVMWIGSMFGYMQKRYGYVADAPNVVQIQKSRDKNFADALYAVYMIGSAAPDNFESGYGAEVDNKEDLDATVWLANKYFGAGTCTNNMEYLYLTFRGMQLSLWVSTPVVQDVGTMLDGTAVDCFNKGDHLMLEVSDIKTTTGVCDLMKALFSNEGSASVTTTIQRTKPDVLFLQGLSFGGALTQGVTYFLLAKGALPAKTKMATLLWGAARAGNQAFAQAFAGYADKYLDQFISYSTMDASGNLHYDPVSMWPKEMVPVGHIYTLAGPANGQLSLTHDLVADPGDSFQVKVKGAAARSIPALDGKSFNCLHLFPLYKRILGTMGGKETHAFSPLCPKR